ncbi:GNAT family N-acetyltransferase [Acetobacter papayae]|uniref:GNAT family N-acetyltransferase n=1 Tax=Acetobacter papayae TaxID=1076592 RepID=UPI0039E883FE
MRVGITFMRMTMAPAAPRLLLPDGWVLEHGVHLSVADYRYLQDRVGRSCCWWMRQAASDEMLARILAQRSTAIGLLRECSVVRGFYELDRRDPEDVNLCYFGLFPQAIGRGVGRAFLDGVLREAWRGRTRQVRVNTSTADHPRARQLYQQAGFRPVRQVEEMWSVPDRLGLDIPQHLRV